MNLGHCPNSTPFFKSSCPRTLERAVRSLDQHNNGSNPPQCWNFTRTHEANSTDQTTPALITAKEGFKEKPERLTSSQEGKADLREAKALWELTSVVFCDSTVFTRPSRTLSSPSASSSPASAVSASLCSRPLPSSSTTRPSFRCLCSRYLANSRGKPWRAKRSSRTARHSSGVGRWWARYGSPSWMGLEDCVGDLLGREVERGRRSRSFLFRCVCIFLPGKGRRRRRRRCATDQSRKTPDFVVGLAGRICGLSQMGRNNITCGPTLL